jgi:hypothetical protein
MEVLAGLVGLAIVVWVGLDARQRDWTGNRIGNKTWHWVVGALFVWIIVIPLYLYQRTRVPLKSDFAGEDLAGLPRSRPRWIVPLAVVLGLGVVAAGGVGGWHHLRLDRANALAVKYGAASSKGEASLADRCVGVMREAYTTTNDPGKAGVPPKTYALLAPKVCALGVERGLVKSDGTMSEDAGRELTLAVIERMGPERVQSLIYTELAVDQYHLATAGKVTRWHRCVAMAYGAASTPSPRSLACPLATSSGAPPAACARSGSSADSCRRVEHRSRTRPSGTLSSNSLPSGSWVRALAAKAASLLQSEPISALLTEMSPGLARGGRRLSDHGWDRG